MIGMGGHEPYPFDAWNFLKNTEKVRKIDDFIEVSPIGVHGLTQKSDLPESFSGKTFNLMENFSPRSASFRPPRHRNKTIGPAEVTPLHDCNPGCELIFSGRGPAGSNRRIIRRRNHPLLSCHTFNQIGKMADIAGAHDKINI